jgi:oxygen-independent coproporphyrinogen-3 oxidase
LIIEPHTPFETLHRQGRLSLPSEDQEQDMAALAHELLTAAGYHQYEVSNWARPGFESHHNQVYWLNEPWLGLGSGAHSYYQRRRWANPFTIPAYMAEGPTPMPDTAQSLQEELEETMFMGLRMTQVGVADSRFRARFGLSLRERYGELLAQLESDGLVTWNGEHLVLSRRGLPLANEVFEAFLGA